MPTYVYRCPRCGWTKEVSHSHRLVGCLCFFCEQCDLAGEGTIELKREYTPPVIIVEGGTIRRRQ